MEKKRSINIIYSFTLLFFFIDFFIKRIVIKNMEPLQSIKVIPKFFSITYAQNSGAAWSILSNSTLLLAILSLVAFIIIGNYIKKMPEIKKIHIFGFSFLLGGILGNFIDRVFYGYVVDYLDFYIFGYDYPIFNFADMLIVVGAVVLVIGSVLNDRKK